MSVLPSITLFFKNMLFAILKLIENGYMIISPITHPFITAIFILKKIFLASCYIHYYHFLIQLHCFILKCFKIIYDWWFWRYFFFFLRYQNISLFSEVREMCLMLIASYCISSICSEFCMNIFFAYFVCFIELLFSTLRYWASHTRLEIEER